MTNLRPGYIGVVILFFLLVWRLPALVSNRNLNQALLYRMAESQQINAGFGSDTSRYLKLASSYPQARDSAILWNAIAERTQGARSQQELPADLIFWGPQLAAEDRLDEALFLLEWSVAQQPESADAWYGLGQVYGELGLTEEAIVAYRKKNGAFKHADELVNIKGIGLKTVERNRDNIQLTAAKQVSKKG